MHSNAQKKRVVEVLSGGAVASQEQLCRAGLWRGAALLGLPVRVVSMATHGHGTVRDVTCVALEEGTLRQAVRVLGHEMGQFELQQRVELQEGYAFARAQKTGGGGRFSIPDGVLWKEDEPVPVIVAAVEVDVSYSRAVLEAKLRGAVEAGFTAYILATVFHDRVRWFAGLAETLAPELPALQGVQVQFINFWSASDPYGERPRCRKLNAAWWSRPEE